jgi:hypothetical protein
MTFPFPDNPDALLTRKVTALALQDAGYPVSEKTLATKATRGGGPPFRKFGSRPLYRWGDSLHWARSRLSPLMHSTSEADAVPTVITEQAVTQAQLRSSVISTPQPRTATVGDEPPGPAPNSQSTLCKVAQGHNPRGRSIRAA